MITEDYVSFETAKLLKEKGFKESCLQKYSMFGSFHIESFQSNWNTEDSSDYSAPTLQTAMKWLEEVHHILVVPDYIYECTNTSWVYKIFRLDVDGKPERVSVKGVSYDENNNPTEHIVGYRDYEVSEKDYATKGESEEEGIRYVLENLI